MEPSSTAKIYLPPPVLKGKLSLEETIIQRTSVRDFASQPVTKAQLSQVLWAAQGLISDNQSRTVPSAGATYSLEIFVVCGGNCLEKVEGGVYQYLNADHAIMLRHEGDLRLALAEAALDAETIFHAPVNIVICGVYERTTARYGARGERYVHMEAGHAGQNIYLQVVTLGLATVAIGAFHDEQVKDVLRLERQCHPLYIMPIGTPV